LKDAALTPFRFAVSKPAQRAYISTFLIALTSITLLGIAATAYVLFYYTYVPVRGFSRPVHLQFESGKQPHGAVSFSSGLLVSGQPYDVQISLHMPQTAANRAAGNFMLDLRLFAPDATGSDAGVDVLAHQSRPAILTYYSPTMEHVHRAAGLPWYILGFRQESEVLDISLMEGIEFSRGWRNIPTSARLELQSQATLQVYSTELIFKARLRGLRYAAITRRMLI
jgi:seipin